MEGKSTLTTFQNMVAGEVLACQSRMGCAEEHGMCDPSRATEFWARRFKERVGKNMQFFPFTHPVGGQEHSWTGRHWKPCGQVAGP